MQNQMSDGNNDHSSQFEQNQILWAKASQDEQCPGMINLYQSSIRPEFLHVNIYSDSPSQHNSSSKFRNILSAGKILEYKHLNENEGMNKNIFQLQKASNHVINPLPTSLNSKSNPHSIKNSHQNKIGNQNTVIPCLLSISQPRKEDTSPTLYKQNNLNQNDHENKREKSNRKRGRKPKIVEKELKNEQRELKMQNKAYRQIRNEKVKELLKKYHLQNIPKAALEKKQINLDPLICRKIYRILKMNGCNVNQGHIKALKLRDKIRKIEDLHKIADLREIQQIISKQEQQREEI